MKVRAAADVRENDDFVIIARTDALATEGFETAIRRLNAYGDAGADVGLIDALESMEQLERAPRECAYPMQLPEATPFLMRPILLRQRFFQVILIGISCGICWVPSMPVERSRILMLKSSSATRRFVF